MIARAVGPRGPNADYLLNTVESLEALGLHDPELVRLAELVRGRLAAGRRAGAAGLAGAPVTDAHRFVRGAA